LIILQRKLNLLIKFKSGKNTRKINIKSISESDSEIVQKLKLNKPNPPNIKIIAIARAPLGGYIGVV